MKLHVLVEGPSENAFLKVWGPRIRSDCEFRIHPHQGKGTFPSDPAATPDSRKRGLLDQLPMKLRAWGQSLDKREERVLVLLDTDDENPAKVRQKFDELLKGIEPCPSVDLLLATEELEAFYFGDLRAMKKAYPNMNEQRARKYVPDSVVGTWELFGEVVGDGGGNKVDWATTMGPRLTIRKNASRSPSFRAVCDVLTGIEVVGKRRLPKKRRKAKAAVPKDGFGRRKRK